MKASSHYVTDWLEKRAQLTPDRIALSDTITGEDTLYAAWNARANRTANLLDALGIRAGDLVSVYASNCAAYLDLLFACGKIGAVLHNLNWRLTVHELRAILADAKPKALVYGHEWSEQAESLRDALDTKALVIAIDGTGAGDIALGERESQPETLRRRIDLAAEHPWSVYYTGGTTGLPKGAVLTHANMTWNSVNTVTSWGITAEHAAPLQLPFFHIGGPNIFMLPLVHVGGRTVLCRGFDVVQSFDLIETGSVTHFMGVPTMFVIMQNHERWADADFSRLALVISGGAPCPLPVAQRFWAKGVDFKTGYGLTEASGNNFWLPAAEVRTRPGSVGYPLFHIDIRVAREDGEECAPDEPGELLIRGPHVFAGYLNRPEATAAVLRDGWLHTGDVARRAADGCTTIIGRIKDMFISGGENVYPAEVESVMHAHPAVAEAALVGVPDERWGECGRAFVVVARDQTLDESTLLTFLAERLAKYKLPRSVVFVETLPRTAVGKIDKLRLIREHG
jgi:fatty-acyl-CoA synthase